MNKIGKEFGVSSSRIAQLCEQMQVPRPPLGHWNKMEYGKADPRPELPKPSEGAKLIWDNENDEERKLKINHKRLKNCSRKLLRNFDQTVSIPKKAHSKQNRYRIHPLLIQAKENFINSRQIEEEGYLKPYKQLLVDITTSRACLDRSLAFASVLFRAFEEAGHNVFIASKDSGFRRPDIDERESHGTRSFNRYGKWSPQRPTVVDVQGIVLGISIVETSEDTLLHYIDGSYLREAAFRKLKLPKFMLERSWTTSKDLPTGRLRLVIYETYAGVSWQKMWQETTNSKLDTIIPSIVEQIEKSIITLTQEREKADREAEARRREWEERWEKSRREDDRRTVEKSIVDSDIDLQKIIESWARVQQIEQFFKQLEQKASSLPKDQENRVRECVKLAREVLGTQDPLDYFLSWKTPEEMYKPKY
ncbi:hypothetical protein [uncultured Cohaesibacter sp.]|uniref:hypothetical protein n=1 Tax=uncultured Cohaesibacter sp. TaxID=1002546 RepID=UPI002AAB6F4A|nr:hypothetical protein [uncultured Cohaesibacter sp.]